MTKKIGRNDKCPCGSGLKYKKCCLIKGQTYNSEYNEIANETEKQTLISILRSVSNSKKIADGDGFYRIFADDKIEKVNPIEYYKQSEVLRRAISLRDLLELKEPKLTEKLSFDFFVRFSKDKLEEEKFWEIKEQTEIHENFLTLLKTVRKKDQISLLKGMTISPDQLLILIFNAYKDYGFLYSRYVFENLPNGMEDNTKPKLAHITEDGVIKTIGNTNLSNGQIKNLIEHRKVIVAHLFDKEDIWHCFFTTHSSLGGKESWKDGQAHFHYISSAFGITREDFVESMKSGQYKSSSIHIDLLDIGKQTISNEK